VIGNRCQLPQVAGDDPEDCLDDSLAYPVERAQSETPRNEGSEVKELPGNDYVRAMEGRNGVPSKTRCRACSAESPFLRAVET